MVNDRSRESQLRQRFATLGQQLLEHASMIGEGQFLGFDRRQLLTWAATLSRSVFAITIDEVAGCEYDASVNGYLQPVPAVSNTGVTISYTMHNDAEHTVIGRVYGYVGDVGLVSKQLLPFQVPPHTSKSGLLEFDGMGPGVWDMRLIWVEDNTSEGNILGAAVSTKSGAADKAARLVSAADSPLSTLAVPRHSIGHGANEIPPKIFASLEFPYLAGDRSTLAPAVRSILGIEVQRDSTGAIIGASATDSDGVIRYFTLVPGGMEYYEKSTQGITTKVLAIYCSFKNNPSRFSCSVNAYPSPNGGLGTAHDELSYELSTTARSATSVNVFVVFARMPSAPGPGPDGSYLVQGGGYTSVDIYKALKGSYTSAADGDPMDGEYIGDDISLYSLYFGDALDRFSYFVSVFADDPTLAAIMTALSGPVISGRTVSPDGVGVVQQALDDDTKVYIGTALALSVRYVCLDARSPVKKNLWGWAGCAVAIMTATAAGMTLTAKPSVPGNKDKGGSKTSAGGSQQGPTPFPSNAECLIDQDCPPGYICLNGVCVSDGTGPGAAPVDTGD
jgi:hypothetical protein